MDPLHIEKLSHDAKCSFAGSWKRFNEKHQGRDQDASLMASEYVVNMGILMSLVFIAIVHRIHESGAPSGRTLTYVGRVFPTENVGRSIPDSNEERE